MNSQCTCNVYILFDFVSDIALLLIIRKWLQNIQTTKLRVCVFVASYTSVSLYMYLTSLAHTLTNRDHSLGHLNRLTHTRHRLFYMNRPTCTRQFLLFWSYKCAKIGSLTTRGSPKKYPSDPPWKKSWRRPWMWGRIFRSRRGTWILYAPLFTHHN